MQTTAMGEVDRFLVPLGDAGVELAFLDRLFVPHRTTERVGAALHRLGWPGIRWRRRFELRPDRDPPLQGRDGSEWNGFLGTLLAELRDGPGARWLDDRLGSRPLRLIVQRHRPQERRHRLVALLLPAGEPSPIAVLKIAPCGALAAEADALTRLRSRLPEPLRSTLPESIAHRSGGEIDSLLLAALPGRPAYLEMQGCLRPAARVAGHFRAAAEWLTEFHSAVEEARAPDVERLTASLSEAVAAVPDAVEADLEWLARLRPDRAGAAAAPVFRHGDFWARNALVDAAGSDVRLCGVVDWEHARGGALLSDDLFHFPFTYGRNFLWSRYRRRDPETAFRMTFLEPTAVSREVRRYLLAYARARGIDPELLRPLLHLYLWTRTREDDGLPERGGTWFRLHRLLDRTARCAFSG